MSEDNDIHCLLQMEGLRIDNKATAEERLALINAALLDEKLSHEDLIAKLDLSILNKSSHVGDQSISQREEEYDDISIAILAAAENDTQNLIDLSSISDSNTVANSKILNESSNEASKCNSNFQELYTQFTSPDCASSMSASICIPSTNFVSVGLKIINFGKNVNAANDITSSFDKAFEDAEPALMICTEDDCSSVVMPTDFNSEYAMFPKEDSTFSSATFNVNVSENYESMFNTFSEANNVSGSDIVDMADLSKSQTGCDEYLLLDDFHEGMDDNSKCNHEQTGSMQDDIDLEIQVLSHIKPSEFQFINKLSPVSQAKFYSRQCHSMFGNGSMPLPNESLLNSACVSNVDAEQENDDIIYLTTLGPSSLSSSPELVSLQNVDKEIIEQPIYRRRSNRRQFSDHSSNHLQVISSQTVVGAPTMSHETNHTLQQDGTFVRDGQHYGPPELSNPPIYPNISKRFTENPMKEHIVSLRDLRFPVCAPNLFASTTTMFRTRSKSFNRKFIRGRSVSPLRRLPIYDTEETNFLRESTEDLHPPIYKRANRNYRSKSVANFCSREQSANYRSGRSCRASPEPSFNGHMNRFSRKDLSHRNVSVERNIRTRSRSVRAKSVCRSFDYDAMDNEHEDFIHQRAVYNWSRGRSRAKSCGPSRRDKKYDRSRNCSPRRDDHVRYNPSRSRNQHGYSSNVQRAMALFNDRKRKIEMEATHFGSNSFTTNNFCNDRVYSRHYNNGSYRRSSSRTSPTLKRMRSSLNSRHSQIDMPSFRNGNSDLSNSSSHSALQISSNRHRSNSHRSKHSKHKSSHHERRRSASSSSTASSSSAYSSASSSSMSSDTAAIIDAVKKLRKHKKRKSKKTNDKIKHKLLKISSNDLNKLFKKWSKSAAPSGSSSGSLCVSKVDYASTSKRRSDRELYEREKPRSHRSRSHLPLESNSDNNSDCLYDGQYYNQNVRHRSRSRKAGYSSSNHVHKKRNR